MIKICINRIVIFKIKNIKPNLLLYIDLWFHYMRFHYPHNFSGTQLPRITRDYGDD
jgi:hypothetical protein